MATENIRVKKGNFLLRFILIAAAFSLPFTYQFFTASSIFDLSSIEMKCPEDMEDDVLLLSGLEEGMNIFDVSPEEVRENLSSHPRIADSLVSRRLPSRVFIEIRERMPVALLKNETGYYRISSDLVITETGRQSDSLRYPVITVADGDECGRVLIPGERLDGTGVGAAMKFLELSSSRVSAHVSEIMADEKDFRIISEEGFPIYFGEDRNMAVKIRNLEDIYDSVLDVKYPAGDVEYINLMSADVPVIKTRDKTGNDNKSTE